MAPSCRGLRCSRRFERFNDDFAAAAEAGAAQHGASLAAPAAARSASGASIQLSSGKSLPSEYGATPAGAVACRLACIGGGGVQRAAGRSLPMPPPAPGASTEHNPPALSEASTRAPCTVGDDVASSATARSLMSDGMTIEPGEAPPQVAPSR